MPQADSTAAPKRAIASDGCPTWESALPTSQTPTKPAVSGAAASEKAGILRIAYCVLRDGISSRLALAAPKASSIAIAAYRPVGVSRPSAQVTRPSVWAVSREGQLGVPA